MDQIHPWEINVYQTSGGRIPFREWYSSLDKPIRSKIDIKLDRIRRGSLGDYKSLGEGIFEFRIHSGGGYRVYFGMDRNVIILLLCGGDKDSQAKDIAKAKIYWQDYKESLA